MDGTGVERFDTGGRVLGWVGLVTAAGLVVVYLTQLDEPEPLPVPLLTGSLCAAVLFWAAILRPRVSADRETLVLRNMLETVRIPLAAVEEHAVRQVLAVRAGDKRYVATGVGRSLRRAATGSRAARSAADPATGGFSTDVDAADFVEARIADLAGDARARAGVARYSAEQVALAAGVRREPAWPVVAAVLGSAVLFVVSLWL